MEEKRKVASDDSKSILSDYFHLLAYYQALCDLHDLGLILT